MESISCIVAALVAFLLSYLTGKKLIPYLRRLKAGQTIRMDGPSWHKAKEGTPTMGGLMFWLGIGAGTIVGFLLLLIVTKDSFAVSMVNIVKVFGGLVMAYLFGLVGVLDDYIKITKKQNLGLTAKQKLLLQFITAAAYLLSLKLCGGLSTVLILPFIGQLDLGFFYYIFALLLIVFTVNAVNITDGIDGLAGSVTVMAALGFLLISGLMQMHGIALLAAAVAGGVLGFLVYNFHPAKVFMGDTGSLFLGGLVAAFAFGINLPILILPIGIIYICEAGSVMLQVLSFKTTGKRIFKMSPIHHHFELSGWGEWRIVSVFTGVTLLGVILSVFAIYHI